MKKINVISGFIITFIFMMLVCEIIIQNFDHLISVILYLVSLFSSTYYFVVRHLIKE